MSVNSLPLLFEMGYATKSGLMETLTQTLHVVYNCVWMSLVDKDN